VTEFILQEGGSFAPASTLGDGGTAAGSTEASTQQPGAAGAGAGGGAAESSPFSGMWVLGLMFVVIWMFLIRPERKRQREAQSMRDSLKKGDQVVTAGGMHGKITGMDEATLTIEVAEKVRVRFNRNSVVAVPSAQKKADDAKQDGQAKAVESAK